MTACKNDYSDAPIHAVVLRQPLRATAMPGDKVNIRITPLGRASLVVWLTKEDARTRGIVVGMRFA